MASTNVCRLDSRSSVNLFTAIGLVTSQLKIYLYNFKAGTSGLAYLLNICTNFNGPLESQLSSR